jgi:urease accessory protein
MKSARPWLIACAILVPLCAHAHSPIKGVMPFYGGVMHPFIVPAHVMAMMALGLFMGRQPQDHSGRLMLSLFAPMVLGVALTGWMGDPDTDIPLLVATCVVAVAVAWGRPWPSALAMAAIGSSALLVGLGSAPDGITGNARWLHLAGCCLGVMVGASAMYIVVEHVQRPWQHIAMRVVCSWIAASALLVLALTVFVPRKGLQSVPSTSSPVSDSVRLPQVQFARSA